MKPVMVNKALFYQKHALPYKANILHSGPSV